MRTIKKGNSSINVAFSGKSGLPPYTNKLFARNIKVEMENILLIDYSHYSKRKRNNLEDSDYQLLCKLHSEISKIHIADDTVKKLISKLNIKKVHIKISDTSQATIIISSFEPISGLLSV